MSETKETLLDKLVDRVVNYKFSKEVEPTKVELETAKLQDGTEVEIEGSDIFILVRQEGEEVERVPAPVGEHTLENGDIVVVQEEGKIAEVKSASEEVEAKDEDDKMDFASEIETLKKEMAELKEAMKPKEEELSKEELSKEEPKKEEPKVELSEEVKKVTHSPEKEVKTKMNINLNKSFGTTKERVYSKLFK